ncbi:S-layer homology domain-containing protein [Paenibacillus foliorum]|uniref:S-layer homology domain-containing protein n=1 Tax=Paenibacillus foliorum TaxID=2654974 RepID=UPI001490E0D3|nr:S-layer homology domain-containing protein [Paenibacillus foliorum]
MSYLTSKKSITVALLASVAMLFSLSTASASTVIPNELPVRSKEEIKAKWNVYKNSFALGDPFVSVPNLIPSNPDIGVLKSNHLETGLKKLNFYRFISGLPDNVTLDSSLSTSAQFGAFIMGVNGEMSHTPSRPSGMSEDVYKKAYDATSSSNIFYVSGFGMDTRYNILDLSVDMYMDDADASNNSRVGHRRWVLNPTLGKIGFGLVKKVEINEKNGTYYAALKVFDRSNTSLSNVSYTSYPGAGFYPADNLIRNQPWSIQLNNQVFSETSTSALTLVVKRNSDGKMVNLGSNNFIYESGGFGAGPAVIFSIPSDFGDYKEGDSYTVKLDGLTKKGGNKTVTTTTYGGGTSTITSPSYETVSLEYTVNFFYLEPSAPRRMKLIDFNRTVDTTVVPTVVPTPVVPTTVPTTGATPTTVNINNNDELPKGSKPIKFTDTGNHWANATVEWAITNEIVDGYADGTFKPDAVLTEEEFLSMFMKSFLKNKVVNDDTKSGRWSDALYILAEKGKFPMLGINITDSRGAEVKRGLVARIIAAADGASVDEKTAVSYLFSKEYTEGKTAKSYEGYAPNDSLTRAEGIQFIKNLKDKFFQFRNLSN